MLMKTCFWKKKRGGRLTINAKPEIDKYFNDNRLLKYTISLLDIDEDQVAVED